MSFEDEKVKLFTRIKDIERSLGNDGVVLYSVILIPTKHLEMANKHIPKTDWNSRNVIFMEDSDYIDQLFSKIH
ncbi:hypothetical protein B0537_04525 [Desulforamulus ferrireducens]|uniref:Uncharacterized protein n=2 Tax=Desulforamulus ferrireducens TaxID=1833852 RepID=A0A1S6IUH0_9FIRM|nr:hypothetical protein B0537_04525 [Desulforamulus ferrireducens]